MKTKKELYYSNAKDLTQEEMEKLADYELNSCDECGNIDNSEQLYWLEYCDLTQEEINQISKNKDLVAVCEVCFNKLKRIN